MLSFFLFFRRNIKDSVILLFSPKKILKTNDTKGETEKKRNPFCHVQRRKEKTNNGTGKKVALKCRTKTGDERIPPQSFLFAIPIYVGNYKVLIRVWIAKWLKRGYCTNKLRKNGANVLVGFSYRERATEKCGIYECYNCVTIRLSTFAEWTVIHQPIN